MHLHIAVTAAVVSCVVVLDSSTARAIAAPSSTDVCQATHCCCTVWGNPRQYLHQGRLAGRLKGIQDGGPPGPHVDSNDGMARVPFDNVLAGKEPEPNDSI